MNEKRWIMMSDGTPQMNYVGLTDLTEEQIDAHIRERHTIRLGNCRAMRTILVPDDTGQITQSNILTSHNIGRGGLEVKILPTSYYWPDQDSHAMAVLQNQINHCEKAETAVRARESGILTLDQPRTNPDGLRIR